MRTDQWVATKMIRVSVILETSPEGHIEFFVFSYRRTNFKVSVIGSTRPAVGFGAIANQDRADLISVS